LDPFPFPEGKIQKQGNLSMTFFIFSGI